MNLKEFPYKVQIGGVSGPLIHHLVQRYGNDWTVYDPGEGYCFAICFSDLDNAIKFKLEYNSNNEHQW